MKRLALPLLGLLAAAFGCSRESGHRAAPAEPVYIRHYRQASALALVSCSETNIPFAGSLRLAIELHAPPGDAVAFPELDSMELPLLVAAADAEPEQALPNGKRRFRQTWELVPSRPGTNELPAFTIRIGAESIATEPIPVVVRSLLPDGIESAELRDIAPAVAHLPEEVRRRTRWGWLAGCTALAALLGYVVRRARRTPEPVLLPPHELARNALAQLPDEPLPRIQELTKILLAFIEAVLRVPTTGRTIAEIVPTLPKEMLLGRREPLERMLCASEQIRFSNRMPSGFAGELEAYVRAFIDEMPEVPPCD